MTRRLAGVFLGLTAVPLVLVGVPYAAGSARARTQELLLDRSADAARLARLAAPAFARDAVLTLAPEVRAYGGLYDVRVEVYDRESRLLLASDRSPAPRAPRAALGQALVGRRVAAAPSVLPWRRASVVVAEPVLRGTEVAGAVVTVSPTARLRREVLLSWLLVLAAGAASLATAALATVPLSRWILRPVRRLDDAVHALTEGDLDAHAEAGDGPPELRRLVASFNRMAEALQTSSRQQRALVADASHQLRNPLAALRLRVDALEPAVVPQARADHRLAVEELDRLARVLDDTLALARAQDGTGEAVAVDAYRCAQGRLRVWSDTAAASDTVLLLEGDGPAWALATPGALEQVLDALLHNAVRAAPGGTVTVTTGRDGARVLVVVADDGPGLSAEQRAAAVRRFWRGPDQQNAPGSGLGLSICATLVARTGGTLVLQPAVPTGLEVVVALPPVALPPVALPAGPPTVPTEEPALSRPRA